MFCITFNILKIEIPELTAFIDTKQISIDLSFIKEITSPKFFLSLFDIISFNSLKNLSGLS
jgi:hypothetical protein